MIRRDLHKTVITLPKPAPSLDFDPADTRPGDDTVVASALPQLQSPLAEPTRRTPAYGPFVPMLLATMALLAWLGFLAWGQHQDRLALQTAYANQQQTVDNATKLRGSLDALAADTQRLAETGNASARLLVEELKKRGVTINPAAATK